MVNLGTWFLGGKDVVVEAMIMVQMVVVMVIVEGKRERGGFESNYLPRMFVNLAEFRLVLGNGNACAIENNKTGAGCALINGADKALF